MKTPHTSVKQGKRVRLILLSGRQIIDKFKQKKGRRVILENGEYDITEIRAMSIYKHLAGDKI